MVGERRAETDMGTHPSHGPWRGWQYMGAARHPEKQEYPSPAPTVTAPHLSRSFACSVPMQPPTSQPRKGRQA